MKAIVTCFKGDADPGGTANEFTLYADVTFVGTTAEIPGRVVNGTGPEGRGVPVSINITLLTQYANNVEDALLAEAARLAAAGGIATNTLARTDCLFPTYQRGA